MLDKAEYGELEISAAASRNGTPDIRLRTQQSTPNSAAFEHLRIYAQCSTLGAGAALSGLTRNFIDSESDSATAELAVDPRNWVAAVKAAESKKALDIKILDLREITSFTDFFLICSVANPRQGHAVSDEIAKQLKTLGELPVSVEGYDASEWILMDYGDLVVHIFSETARSYYDLERLWRHAKQVNTAAL